MKSKNLTRCMILLVCLFAGIALLPATGAAQIGCTTGQAISLGVFYASGACSDNAADCAITNVDTAFCDATSGECSGAGVNISLCGSSNATCVLQNVTSDVLTCETLILVAKLGAVLNNCCIEGGSLVIYAPTDPLGSETLCTVDANCSGIAGTVCNLAVNKCMFPYDVTPAGGIPKLCNPLGTGSALSINGTPLFYTVDVPADATQYVFQTVWTGTAVNPTDPTKTLPDAGGNTPNNMIVDACDTSDICESNICDPSEVVLLALGNRLGACVSSFDCTDGGAVDVLP